MKVFCDTEAVVASIAANHPHHEDAWHVRELIHRGDLTGYLSAHSLAEIYAILTRAPFQPKFSALEVWRVLQDDILPAFALVPLDPDEYRTTIEYCSRHRWLGGRVYDALHIAAARKADCDIIYTFNVRHFRELAPDLAGRIRAPRLP